MLKLQIHFNIKVASDADKGGAYRRQPRKENGTKMSSTAFEGRLQIGGNEWERGTREGVEQRVDTCARATRVSHWSCQATIEFVYLSPPLSLSFTSSLSLPLSLCLQLCWVSFLRNNTLSGDSARRVLIRHAPRLFRGIVLLSRGRGLVASI